MDRLQKKIKFSADHLSYITNTIHFIHIPEVSSAEIIQIISSLKNTSSVYDDISVYIGKTCIDMYIEPLTSLFNESLKQGIFSNEMNLAKLLPIYKNENK